MKLISWDIARLGELTDLWNQELEKEFPMRKELFEQNSFQDMNICYQGSCIAVDENEEAIGFIVAKKWQEKLDVSMRSDIGWIQVLLVDHRFRNKGIGRTLLEHAETAFKTVGITKILLGRDPWHYFPGIPKQYQSTATWFEKRGYQKQDSDYDLICTYDQTNKSAIPLTSGVEVVLAGQKDERDILAFLHRCFPGRWEYEAMHYFQKGGTGREFVLLKKDDTIIGFCRINDVQSPLIAQNVYWAPLFKEELGGIGPLGIDANERKNGYGLLIVEAAVAYLRDRGIHKIVIDWTGLVDFYKKLGYDVWKRYHAYSKIIDEGKELNK